MRKSIQNCTLNRNSCGIEKIYCINSDGVCFGNSDIVNKIRVLYLHNNQLKNIDKLRKNKTITDLDVSFNLITKIDKLSENTTIRHLDVSNNKIEKINKVSPILKTLFIYRNKLKSICLLPNVVRFVASFNKIETIDILVNTKIKILDLNSNKIKDVNQLANNKNLEFLNLDNNLIENVDDLIKSKTLYSLYLRNNPIKSDLENSHIPILRVGNVEIEEKSFQNYLQEIHIPLPCCLSNIIKNYL